MLLQGCLNASIRIGLRSLLVVSGWFALYIVGGFVGSALGLIDLSYPLFSLEEDPFFAIGTTLIGLCTGLDTSSILLYHLLVGFDEGKSRFDLLMGLSASALVSRYSVLPSLSLLRYFSVFSK